MPGIVSTAVLALLALGNAQQYKRICIDFESKELWATSDRASRRLAVFAKEQRQLPPLYLTRLDDTAPTPTLASQEKIENYSVVSGRDLQHTNKTSNAKKAKRKHLIKN